LLDKFFFGQGRSIVLKNIVSRVHAIYLCCHRSASNIIDGSSMARVQYIIISGLKVVVLLKQMDSSNYLH